MKQSVLILLIALAFVGCKEEKKETEVVEQSSEITQMTGNFMYYEDAAVFQTRSELYGVVENQLMEDLVLQSQPLKTEPTDEVLATLKVKVSKKPENQEGWENRIEIFEIIKVSKINPENQSLIKLENIE